MAAISRAGITSDGKVSIQRIERGKPTAIAFAEHEIVIAAERAIEVRQEYLETHLKASGLTALGVMVDADQSAASRWTAIRARIIHRYPEAPEDLPACGAVLHSEGSPSFGAWVRPDNSNRGMLETFLLHLRPQDNSQLLALGERAVMDAQSLGAPFKPLHVDKAKIHTWLAWQNPPGRQLHNAIMEKMLERQSPEFRRFISWFRDVYSLQRW